MKNLTIRRPSLNIAVFLLSLMAAAAAGQLSAQESTPTHTKTGASKDGLKALIIDGQNNHGDWPKTTMMMRQYLIESGRFDVGIARTKYTWNGGELINEFPLDDGKTYENLPQAKPDPEFKPKFSDYDVVISNFGFGAADWPEETKTAFVDYVHNGGGLVVVHAADNSFGDWKEFNQIIGLGGWGGRDEKSGPYVYVDANGKQVRDDSPGAGGGHGPQHEFEIIVRDSQHPITRGIPTAWLHTKDELYERLRGPAENMKLLATAFASKEFNGTGRHEPMMMTVEYGKGRCFHTPMGHAAYSMECVGFITTFLRGTEWAATGDVTLTDIPDDFPTRDKSSARKFELAKPLNAK
jgi:type 1 glutamine amidotransferase